MGADLLEVGGSYASLVEAVSHRLEPREPLVVPLRVSGHKASFGGSRFDPARALQPRTPDPGTPPREPGARVPSRRPSDQAKRRSANEHQRWGRRAGRKTPETALSRGEPSV